MLVLCASILQSGCLHEAYKIDQHNLGCCQCYSAGLTQRQRLQRLKGDSNDGNRKLVGKKLKSRVWRMGELVGKGVNGKARMG